MGLASRISRPAPRGQVGVVGRPGAAGRAATPRPRLGALRVTLDSLCVLAAAGLAFPLRFRWRILEATQAPFDLRAHVVTTLVWLGAVLTALASSHLYDEDTVAPGGGELGRLGRAFLQAIAVVSTVVFLLRLVTVSRGWFALLTVLTIVLLTAERRLLSAIVKRLRVRGHLRRPAIVVSTEAPAEPHGAIYEEFDVLDVIGPGEVGDVLADANRWQRPPAVIVQDHLDDDVLWRLVLDTGRAGSPVFVRSAFRSLPTDRVMTRALDDRTVVKVSPPAIAGARAFAKRLFDIAAALVLLPVLAIPLAAIALTVLVTSGRPVLYRQPRVGKDGRTFSMPKFRTMRVDAEAHSGPVWATNADPRRTAFGRVLRRFSLDELPQLWNVLGGQMSIVGPRPERPLFVARFNEDHLWYRFRHRIRPGLTGLAQVRGLRGDTALEPRIDSDNWYIENWSIGLDLRIAGATLFEMFRGRNAH